MAEAQQEFDSHYSYHRDNHNHHCHYHHDHHDHHDHLDHINDQARAKLVTARAKLQEDIRLKVF